MELMKLIHFESERKKAQTLHISDVLSINISLFLINSDDLTITSFQLQFLHFSDITTELLFHSDLFSEQNKVTPFRGEERPQALAFLHVCVLIHC